MSTSGTLFLGTATVEEIVESLIAMSERRPGLAYDVGALLIEKGVSKEFPGPPFGWWPRDPNENGPFDVRLLRYDPARRREAIVRLRDVWQMRLSEAKHFIDQVEAGTEVGLAEVLRPKDSWTARDMVTRLAEVGIEAKLVPDPEEPPASHRRILGHVSGPIG